MQDSHIIRPLSEIDAQPYRAIRLRAIVDSPSTMWPTNVAASNFYRSLGFESFGIKPRVLWIGGRFYDEEQMVLRLDD